MEWFSFILGASLVAVCVAVWSQFKQWRDANRERSSSMNRRFLDLESKIVKQSEEFVKFKSLIGDEVKSVKSTTSYILDENEKRFQKLEKRRR